MKRDPSSCLLEVAIEWAGSGVGGGGVQNRPVKWLPGLGLDCVMDVVRVHL